MQFEVVIYSYRQVYLLSAVRRRDNEPGPLSRFLWPIEPVSFNRGQAIIAYLQNNRMEALGHLEKVKNIIEKNEQSYGFFQAEKTLTNMVEEKIVSA